MITRTFWLRHIEDAWRRRSIVWFAGVRRTGKTCLCQALPDTEYFDCELPRVRRLMADPEAFLDGLHGKRVAFDEVHRLENPSQLLKIAADHYPDIRVLATGSSTLSASSKFRDTLTGRKQDLWLTPMCLADLEAADQRDLPHRFLHGGLPPFFLTPRIAERDFQEWMDAYWAKDIQDLFRLERRSSFQRFTELVLAQSGGIFEATRFAQPCEISRSTVSNYLNVLDETWVAHVLRPFSTHRATEIIAAPKVYGFDTGFVCYHRGWHELRPSDLGVLWEHFVLNEIMAVLQTRQLNYWRDKRGHEVDFVLARRGVAPIGVECKWSADGFDPGGLAAFRRQYPAGANYVVAQDVSRTFARKYHGLSVQFVGLAELVARLARKTD